MKMKMAITVAYFFFSLFSSSAFAASNADTISQCSVIFTIMSAKSLAQNWPADSKRNIQNNQKRFDTYGVQEFGSMAAFAQYNKTYGNRFYQWLNKQPNREDVETEFLKKCIKWVPK
jgi:hypothetical protein